eukprot:5183071-Prorocentrum_lima.AAC.1
MRNNTNTTLSNSGKHVSHTSTGSSCTSRTREPSPAVLMFPIASTTGVEKCYCLACDQADPNR